MKFWQNGRQGTYSFLPVSNFFLEKYGRAPAGVEGLELSNEQAVTFLHLLKFARVKGKRLYAKVGYERLAARMNRKSPSTVQKRIAGMGRYIRRIPQTTDDPRMSEVNLFDLTPLMEALLELAELGDSELVLAKSKWPTGILRDTFYTGTTPIAWDFLEQYPRLNPRISDTEAMMIIQLVRYHSVQKVSDPPSYRNKTHGLLAGVTPSQASKCMSNLKKNGYIKIIKNTGRRNQVDLSPLFDVINIDLKPPKDDEKKQSLPDKIVGIFKGRSIRSGD